MREPPKRRDGARPGRGEGAGEGEGRRGDELPPDLASAIRRFASGLPAPRTREEYEKALRDFLTRAGVRTLEELLAVTSDRVVDYRNALQEAKLSPATLKLRLSALSGFYAEQVRAGKLPANPADPRAVRRLPLSELSPTEGLSLAEIQAMIRSCDPKTVGGLRDRAVLVTLLYEGLRRSEISNLDHRDLATRRGLLEIRDAKRSAYDAVRLHPQAEWAIGRYLEALRKEEGRGEFGPQDPVFVSFSRGAGEDRRLCAASVNAIVKAAARRAGIERAVSAHSMRHACATLALEGCAPVHQVQRHLRHRDIRTTLRYDRARDVRKNPTIEAIPPLED